MLKKLLQQIVLLDVKIVGTNEEMEEVGRLIKALVIYPKDATGFL